MKVIDLLNKMANDEDYRPTVVFSRVTFTYNTIVGDYENDRDSDYGIFANYVIENILNDKVEVIEENKEIKELKELNKISYNEFKYTDTKHRFDLTNIEYDKINELVREVNKINRQLEEQETEDIDTVERELNKMFKEREEK